MKSFLGLIVLLALGCGAVYYFGGYGSWDPSEQGQQKRAQIQPGMSCAKIFDEITGNPRKYRIINMRKEHGHEMLVPSAEVNFDRARVDDHIRNNGLPYGFTATFVYSQAEAFTMTFDSKGNIVALEDAVTMADVLQMNRKRGHSFGPTADWATLGAGAAEGEGAEGDLGAEEGDGEYDGEEGDWKEDEAGNWEEGDGEARNEEEDDGGRGDR